MLAGQVCMHSETRGWTISPLRINQLIAWSNSLQVELKIFSIWQMDALRLNLGISMARLASSKIFASSFFVLLSAVTGFHVLATSDDLMSSVLAVVPASTVVTISWFTLIRLTYPKSENAWIEKWFTKRLQRPGIYFFYVWLLFPLYRFSRSWANTGMVSRYGTCIYACAFRIFLGNSFCQK